MRLEDSRALLVSSRLYSVLTSIDFNDKPVRVAHKVSDVSADLYLPTKMCARYREPVAQVPPQFAFRFRRRGTHLAGKPPLRRNDRAFALGPDSRLVSRGHVTVLSLRPPPPTPPHKGEGSTPSLWHHRVTAACGCRRTSGGCRCACRRRTRPAPPSRPSIRPA